MCCDIARNNYISKIIYDVAISIGDYNCYLLVAVIGSSVVMGIILI